MQILPETIEKHYDIILNNETEWFKIARINPRDYLELRIGVRDVFKYLNILLDIKPKLIADIGCGRNHFKKFIPHLIGVDPNFIDADIQEEFNKDFSIKYTQYFDAAFSIDSLHFIPLDYMKTRILEFVNIIKPGGRGYISLNLARLVEDAPWKKNTQYLLDMFGTQDPTVDQCKAYVEKELDTLNLDIIICEVDFDNYNAFLNGNIRLLFNV